jgi:LPXTG-site transpeptidase (sortase) family protein
MRPLANVLAVLGILALTYWAFEFAHGPLYQAIETRRFARERLTVQRPADKPSPLKSATPVERPLYPDIGSAVAVLAIPRLGLRGTSLPGGGRNVGVARHRDTFFRPLRRIRKDDTIQVITRAQEYHYKVVSTEIVEPAEIQVLYPTVHETLTLVTCYPFEFVGPGAQEIHCQGRVRGLLTVEPDNGRLEMKADSRAIAVRVLASRNSGGCSICAGKRG